VDSNSYFSTYGWTTATGLTVNSSSTKYATKYDNISSSHSGNLVFYSYGKVGDATKEVNTGGNYSITSTTTYNSWFSDHPHFTYSNSPFFVRGGSWNYSDGAGVFCSNYQDNFDYSWSTFRTVLCP
jgi:hypothetical protein